jgi:PIN domain.
MRNGVSGLSETSNESPRIRRRTADRLLLGRARKRCSQKDYDRVENGEVTATINTITCAEVQYVCGRDDPETAQAYVTRIRDWCDVTTAESVWELAADYKRDYNVALGDAFTLATAATKDATAYTGADDDFDDVNVAVRRFREEGVN